MPRNTSRGGLRAACILPALLSAASTASAQAWVPPKGEGIVSVLFSNVVSTDHFLPDVRVDRGRIDSHTFLFDLTYGISDRMAVTVGLPVLMTKYTGNSPHRPITLDDGTWQTTAQDFRVNVRYNVARGPLVVTPFIGTNLPSHGYEFYAHAAPGRRLKQILGGVSVAKLFADQGLVLQGRYAFGVSERVLDLVPRHSEVAMELGYFVRPSVRVFGMAAGRLGHTGIDLTTRSSTTLPIEVFRHHDRISREHALNLGIGGAVSLSETLDLFGSYTTTVTGRNTHAINRGLAVGVSWSFRRSGASRVARGPEGSLVKCLCQKSGE